MNGDAKMCPDDMSGVVWAISMISSFLLCFFILELGGNDKNGPNRHVWCRLGH